MAITRGVDCKIYYNTTGLSGGTWVHADSVREVNLTESATIQDTTTRADGGATTGQPGLVDHTVEVTMPEDPADTHYGVFRAAWANRSTLAIGAFSNQTTSAGIGPLFQAHVTQFATTQPIDDTAMVSVVLTPAPGGASVPSYTLSGV